ncbi:MAG: Asp-tRNA(Asn)/Glu-tRNA(Gln) amidotransferase subunit GatC [Patescibacteria group bacterium]|nr:Asp-tRNA(Asn)/Glu-tRNA(Gln) amidotransferase subunit GatC [Patescibacteria group bacterium]
MELTKDEVRDIALLARIGVTDEEIDLYQKDMSSVLQYFDKLQEVDTDNVEEIGHITGVTNVYRSDVENEMSEEGKKMIMDNVPQKKDGYIKVKSVL